MLGIWLAKTAPETATAAEGFGGSVMADLKNRGVRDILIACCDGLAGSGDAIVGAFPATVVQRCVVHYADLGIMPTWHRDPARPYAQARAKPRKQGHKLYPHPPCRSAWCRRC